MKNLLEKKRFTAVTAVVIGALSQWNLLAEGNPKAGIYFAACIGLVLAALLQCYKLVCINNPTKFNVFHVGIGIIGASIGSYLIHVIN